MRLFRIADQRHALWDGTGAALLGGRWNRPGTPVIYAATSQACALLEVLVHGGIGKIPTRHGMVIATLADTFAVERADPAQLPADWVAPDSASARGFGDAWLVARRTAVLLVPSAIARHDWNALVNPMHPDAAGIAVGAAEPVIWDRRLFQR